MGGSSTLGLFERDSFHALEAAFQKRIGPGFDPSCDVVIRRAAVGRFVFEATVVGRIVRRRDDNAVGQSFIAAAVVSEYCVRNHRSGRVFILIREHDFHTIGRQHFERVRTSPNRQRVRVNAEIQRAAYAVALAVVTNSLTDGQHMPLVESDFKGAATMPRGAERHTLRGDRRIGSLRVVRSHQPRDIDQHRERGRLSCQRANLRAHG
jgi:hypothetical protein